MTDPFDSPPTMSTQYVKASTVKLLLDGCGIGTRTEIQHAIEQRFGFAYASTTNLYPYDDYLRIADYLATLLYSHKDREVAYEEMGYRAINVFFTRPAGQVIKLTAAVIGPTRSTPLFLKRLQLALPFATHSFEIESSNALRYHVQQVGGPAALMRGVLRASAEAAGAKNVQITTTTRMATDRIYRITWT